MGPRSGSAMGARPRAALLVAAAVLGLGTGCGDGIVGDDPDTGLRVEVRKGPIEPLEREDDPGDNTAPVDDARVRVRGLERDGRVTLRTDTAGEARVRLVPGRYEVEVVECPGALILPGPDTVEVTSGQVVSSTRICDTGIR